MDGESWEGNGTSTRVPEGEGRHWGGKKEVGRKAERKRRRAEEEKVHDRRSWAAAEAVTKEFRIPRAAMQA